MKPARGRAAARRKTYHHGDLRQALVGAALALLESGGATALSLRAAARRAGVSQAAPYNHFRDKDALLAAVAAEGFRALEAETIAARDRVADPSMRMMAIGKAYVMFAVRRPALFRLMFGPAGADPARDTELATAARASFAALETTMDGAGIGGDRADHLAAWALVHGIATLLIDKRLAIPDAALDATIGLVLGRMRFGATPSESARVVGQTK
jgi:AcrR family transcriptional regulator